MLNYVQFYHFYICMNCVQSLSGSTYQLTMFGQVWIIYQTFSFLGKLKLFVGSCWRCHPVLFFWLAFQKLKPL